MNSNTNRRSAFKKVGVLLAGLFGVGVAKAAVSTNEKKEREKK